MNDAITLDSDNSEALTMDSLFPTGQIHLSEFSVYNWGTFSNIHTLSVDKGGTFITGETGAGKSTLVDALSALTLSPGKTAFNTAAAQGDKADRNLMGYLRGTYGTQHDGIKTKSLNKREGAVLSAVQAKYTAENGQFVTLVALFWVTGPTMSLSDVQRRYLVSHRDLPLKELLGHYRNNSDRDLKAWLDTDPATACYTKIFSEYEPLYMKALYIENKNAPRLLSRALGLKKIDNLNDILRELVLEPSQIKSEARKVVAEFDDLIANHDNLVDARDQRDRLTPLVEDNEIIEDTNKKIDDYKAEESALSRYVYQAAQSLCITKIKRIDDVLETIDSEIKDNIKKENAAEEDKERAQNAYLVAGGGELNQIESAIKAAVTSQEQAIGFASKYQEVTKDLGLSEVLEHSAFMANQQQQEEGLYLAGEASETKLSEFIDLSTRFANKQKSLKALEGEVAEIKRRPNSNIAVNYQQLRDLLVKDLELDPTRCLFIGELISVKDSDHEWRGAIERALGMQRLTLVVPNHTYSQVTHWLNQRHNGLYVRVQAVNSTVTGHTQFKDRGFLRKLEWRKHPYRDWLKQHLAPKDLSCVDSTTELDKTPFSMTMQGLVHLKQGTFEKKDQTHVGDRRNWYLGFSNTSRLKALEEAAEEEEDELKGLGSTLTADREALDESKKTEEQWAKLAEFTWDEIDTLHWTRRLEELREQQATIKENKGDLEKAKKTLDDAKYLLKALNTVGNELNVKLGEVTAQKTAAKKQQAKIDSGAEGDISAEMTAQLHHRVKPLVEADLDDLSELVTTYTTEITKLLNQHQVKNSSAVRRAIAVMSAFRSQERWQAITLDWGSELDSLSLYLDHLNKIKEEGLPELEERFKERLNRHATQSISKLEHSLEAEQDQIVKRIELINDVLQKAEFRKGTALQLSVRPENFEHVVAFKREMRETMSMATSTDHEARYQQLAGVVKTMEKASDPASSDTLESLRLLDPRYQLTFIAEERDRESDEIKDIWVSSHGKSGGEKESFAGAIVAASLAYALTPDGYHKPIYSTVFLDEAFSNSSEAVSRRVMKIFKDLQIHINLITPFKNLSLAKDNAKKLVIIEKQAANQESDLMDLSWGRVNELIEKARREETEKAAKEAGIERVS